MEESHMHNRLAVTAAVDVIAGNVYLLSEILLRLPARLSSGTESWRSCCRFYAHYTMRFDSGVFWNGAIHWLGEGSSIHFDVKKNMPPRPRGGFDEKIRYIGESGGHLSLAQVQSLDAKKFKVHELDKVTWK